MAWFAASCLPIVATYCRKHPKRRNHRNHRKDSSVPDPIIIFTDGACTGNPGPGGWAAIISSPQDEIRELGGGERATTNNRMEMLAALSALAEIKTVEPVEIIVYTDSTYLIKGITQWIWGWRSRGWKNAEGKDVANRDLWEALAQHITRLKPATVSWKYVRGHAGIPGNERCDEIAVCFANGRDVDLYRGSGREYTVDLKSLPVQEELPAQKSSSAGGGSGGSSGGKSAGRSSGKSGGSSGGSASYLSYHGGVVRRHKTWSACEQRVKGQSNAKFKKAKSAQEEREILRGWGVDPSAAVIDE
jgi:ribonuclease HI